MKMADEIVLKDQSAVPAHILASAQSFAGAGLEEVRAKDVKLPRVLLMQALTPLVAESGKFRSGDLVNNIDESLLVEANKPAKIVVVKHFLGWIRWTPKGVKPAKILESSHDPVGSLAKEFESYTWDKEEARDVVEYHNFLVFFPEINPNLLFALSCGKTNHKHGKALVTRMKMRGPHLAAWSGLYTLSTANETNNAGQTYKVYAFANDGWASPEMVKQAEGYHSFIGKKKVDFEQDPDGDDADKGTKETEL
jgi:hypothetical protein